MMRYFAISLLLLSSVAQAGTCGLPAERARGLVFCENFESAESIAGNSGTITGALEYSQQGAYFDGANDYVSYAGVDNYVYNSGFSLVVEFIPNFEHDDNASHEFYRSTSAEYRVVKFYDNTINFNALSAVKLSVAAGAYGQYWKVGERNVLVVSVKTGDNKMYLNGHFIGSSVDAWSSCGMTSFSVGASFAGGQKFNGHFKSMKKFNTVITAQEATDYYNNSTFNYMDKAVLALPMGNADHDPTNTQTLDRSGNGNNATWTAGATAPTKLTKHGYNFDGSDDLFIAPDTPSGTYTICSNTEESDIICENDLTTWNKIFTGGALAGKLRDLAWWNFALTATQEYDWILNAKRRLNRP